MFQKNYSCLFLKSIKQYQLSMIMKNQNILIWIATVLFWTKHYCSWPNKNAPTNRYILALMPPLSVPTHLTCFQQYNCVNTYFCILSKNRRWVIQSGWWHCACSTNQPKDNESKSRIKSSNFKKNPFTFKKQIRKNERTMRGEMREWRSPNRVLN